MNTFEISSIFIGTLLRLAIPVVLTVVVVGLLRFLDARWQAEALQQATTVGGMRIPVQNVNGQLQEACLGCAFHKAKISMKTSAIQ